MASQGHRRPIVASESLSTERDSHREENYRWIETREARFTNPESPITNPGSHPYRSVAATSASTLAGSKAEWPASAVITRSASGKTRFRSQAFWIGQTTS